MMTTNPVASQVPAQPLTDTVSWPQAASTIAMGTADQNRKESQCIMPYIRHPLRRSHSDEMHNHHNDCLAQLMLLGLVRLRNRHKQSATSHLMKYTTAIMLLPNAQHTHLAAL